MVERKDNREAQFNMGMAQTMHIAELLRKVTAQYLAGNSINMYFSLCAIRRLVNYDLNEEERQELDAMEKEIQSQFRIVNEFDEQIRVKDKNVYGTLIKKYELRIMDLLKELGFFPNKEDRTRLNF